MEKGERRPQQSKNPLELVQSSFKHLETDFKAWLTKQSLPIEAAVVTFGIMGTLTSDISSSSGWRRLPASSGFGWWAMDASEELRCDDWRQCRDILCYEEVAREGGYRVEHGCGIWFRCALFIGGIFKLGQKFCKVPSADKDLYYSKTKSMLSNLGLDRYEKNFKNGLLTDYTLPLLNDSALSEVKIPPGPRLLILDHIQRDPEFQEKRKH